MFPAIPTMLLRSRIQMVPPTKWGRVSVLSVNPFAPATGCRFGRLLPGQLDHHRSIIT